VKRSILTIILITLLIFLASCTATIKVQQYKPGKATVENIESYVEDNSIWDKMPFYVKVHILTEKGYAGGCTGNIISKTAVLTAAHCLDSAKVILIEKNDGTYYKSTKIFYDENYTWVRSPEDVGVVLFDEEIAPEEDIVPLMDSSYLEPGEVLILGGFRVTAERRIANVFEVGRIIITEVNETHVVTRYTGLKPDHYPCFGSSGGGALAIIVKNQRIHKVGLVSVVSRGGWICEFPGARVHHSRVDKNLEFIKKHVPDFKTL
jgi:hypothetical protein